MGNCILHQIEVHQSLFGLIEITFSEHQQNVLNAIHYHYKTAEFLQVDFSSISKTQNQMLTRIGVLHQLYQLLKQSNCQFFNMPDEVSQPRLAQKPSEQLQLSVLSIYMGGVNQNTSREQLLKNTCHEGLMEYQYEPNSQTLWKVIKAQASIKDWYNDISRLQSKHHIFMPVKIIDYESFQEGGCCAQQNGLNPQIQFKKVYYPAFFYTLQKEILARILKKHFFREQELWKLVNYLSKACIQWQQTYPNQSLGVICPQNVIISSKGHVKLVCKISFYQQAYESNNSYYYAPQQSAKSIIKYSLNPNSDPQAYESASVYSIGAVILELANLVPSSEQITLPQRLNLLKKLKYTIQQMMKENPAERSRLAQVIRTAKPNRTKYL